MTDQLYCEECERAVVVELGLNPPTRVICTDCEEKQDHKRLSEVAEKLMNGQDITAEDIRVAFDI